MNRNFSYHQLGYMALYIVLIVIALAVIHEAAHILMAVIRGIPFNELKLGLRGINPSVTLPRWAGDDTRIIFFYAGGLTTGAIFLLGYLLYWVRKYRRQPSLLYWATGLTTVMLAAEQFAAGYLEGRYHSVYILSATALLSPSDILIWGCVTTALFGHFSLCPPRMIRKDQSILQTK